MEKVFVPYNNDSPAAINIKGHRLLIVTASEDQLAKDLDIVGGNSVRELEYLDTPEDQTEIFASLAESIKGGVVLNPPGMSLSTLIKNLEHELPWVH